MVKNIDEWHKIGNKLCHHLQICNCQRKLKSFVDILVRIHGKLKDCNWSALTMEELFICNLLDANSKVIDHGINCEYPYLGDSEFWEWVLAIQHDPNLEDRIW